ncbi:MAG: SEC-C motif domain protein [bacterium]|nr:MAG: SEC-C motif domain protein [bacterium]KAF0150050.1 MAG: SEC-C motif domain protein [bacterium]KAF0169158.1 MAG: SEC-C motif domain protein [bacterium]TXT16206.1 MAG: SEC-C motif domain protein [bacterium]
MTSVTSIPCPCGSGLELARCCGPYLRGERLPPDAQALMRSRYSAYVLGDEVYLLDTWHPRTRPAELGLDRDGRVRWLGLKVRKHEVLDADHARVAFLARYKIDGKAHRLEENSRFTRIDGRWLYVDAEETG